MNQPTNQPNKPNKPANQSSRTNPTNPAEQTQQTKPTNPTNQTQPIQPTNPTQPNKPNPTNQTQPIQPNKPNQQTNPTNLTNPANEPNKPNQQTQQTKPNQSSQQTQQTKQTNPTNTANMPKKPRKQKAKRKPAMFWRACYNHVEAPKRWPPCYVYIGEQFAGLGAIHNCAVLCSVGNTSVYEFPNIRADSILCDQQVWAADADSLDRASTATRPTKPTWRAYWSSTQALPTTPGPVKTACCETHLLFTTM